MSTITTIKDKAQQLGAATQDALQPVRAAALAAFNQLGVPAVKHEEWKYTRISQLFNQPYQLGVDHTNTDAAWQAFRLPEYETANELVFINGV
ncbi:Fe-S cluster assembly protein SufD, partial [Flavihumibacter sediminis]|nr:Fe-S cluster assembly protein SufD [Flavihumibacter sediminis]